MTTFVSQNMGAGRPERVKQGVRIAFVGGTLFAGAASFLILIFTPQISRLFGSDEGMLFYANLFLSQLIMLQLVHVGQSVYSSALRGFGQATRATMAILSGLIVVRQIYLFVVTRFINTPVVVGLAFPLGWLASGSFLYMFYRLYWWKHS